MSYVKAWTMKFLQYMHIVIYQFPSCVNNDIVLYHILSYAGDHIRTTSGHADNATIQTINRRLIKGFPAAKSYLD